MRPADRMHCPLGEGQLDARSNECDSAIAFTVLRARLTRCADRIHHLPDETHPMPAGVSGDRAPHARVRPARLLIAPTPTRERLTVACAAPAAENALRYEARDPSDSYRGGVS